MVADENEGETFPFYVVRTLGAGRTSIVYECRSDYIDTTVCVKCEPLDDCSQLVNEFNMLQV